MNNIEFFAESKFFNSFPVFVISGVIMIVASVPIGIIYINL